MVAVTVSAPRRAARNRTIVAQPCPLCDSPMELRRAGEDGRSGTWFWGCTRFPHCRGMISAPQPAPQSEPSGPARAPKQARQPRAPRRAKPRMLRWLTFTLLLITLLGIALLGSVPTLAP